MGGDEFCVLIRSATADAALVDASVAALSERGSGFAIDAAHGEVSIPAEGNDTAAILQLADQRLYARKEQRRTVPDPEVTERTVPAGPGVVPDVVERRFSRR